MNPFKVKNKISISTLIIFLIIPQLVGVIAAIIIKDQTSLYGILNKPSFAPPSFVFGPVWTILYLLMGIASYRIMMLRSDGINISFVLWVYFFQLGLNFFWSIIFFRFQEYGYALWEIIVMLVFIFFTLILFFNKDKLAGWLMAPYALWVCFATVLNFFVVLLNT